MLYKSTTYKSLFKSSIFLGGKVFTDHLAVSELIYKVRLVDFDACLTSLVFHFTSSQSYHVLI